MSCLMAAVFLQVNSENVVKVGHRQVVNMIRQGGNHLVLKVVTVTRNLDPDDTARKKGACSMPPHPLPHWPSQEPWPWEGWAGGGFGYFQVCPPISSPGGSRPPESRKRSQKGG